MMAEALVILRGQVDEGYYEDVWSSLGPLLDEASRCEALDVVRGVKDERFRAEASSGSWRGTWTRHRGAKH